MRMISYQMLLRSWIRNSLANRRSVQAKRNQQRIKKLSDSECVLLDLTRACKCLFWKLISQEKFITWQIQIKKIPQLLTLGFFAFFITACTTAGNAIPQGGPTMAQVYEQAMQKSNNSTLDAARRKVQTKTISNSQNLNNENRLSAYTRTSQNEINNLFPQLPNPQLVMYVYPHFAGNEEVPVPGYSTAFYLFEKTHYKLVD
jgi:conjugative transfer region lipoprotein (TIGR03751 family)